MIYKSMAHGGRVGQYGFTKKLLFSALILLSSPVSILAQGSKAVSMQGNITGLGSAMIYLKKTDNATSKVVLVDSTRAVDGRFTFRRTIPEVDFYNVLAAGLPGQVLLIWDGDVTLEGQREAFREAEVKGSALTDAWLKFQDEVEKPYRDQLMTLYNDRQKAPKDTAVANKVTREEKRLKQEQYQKVAERIRSNPNSLLSLYLLNWYWPQFPRTEARTLYSQLDAALKNHSVAKRLERQLL